MFLLDKTHTTVSSEELQMCLYHIYKTVTKFGFLLFNMIESEHVSFSSLSSFKISMMTKYFYLLKRVYDLDMSQLNLVAIWGEI